MAKNSRRIKAMASSGKTFCEFFAGIGLVREGLTASSWSCVYANDISEKKREMYEGRFGGGGHFHLGDVWDTDSILERIPGTPFLATASFPCVDLSLAGHWKGFDGEHSSTFFGFTKAIEAMGAMRPRLIMLENVTGFITSKGGRDFESAVRAMASLGYWLDAFVVDACHFLPQSRPRVFVVGLHESVEAPQAVRKSKVDWIADEWSRRIESDPYSVRPRKLVDLMRSIELPTGWSAFNLPVPREAPPGVAEFIDRDDEQDWWDTAGVKKHRDMMHERHRKLIDEMLEKGETFVGTIYRRKRGDKTMAEVRFDGVAGCLRTPKGGSARQIVVVVEKGDLRMRWMSAREYARLQGAPSFPLMPNTIQNLHGFGDAVCVPVISWIDKHVLTPVFEWHSSNEHSHADDQLDRGEIEALRRLVV